MKLNPLTKAAIGLTAAGAAYVLVQKEDTLDPGRLQLALRFTALYRTVTRQYAKPLPRTSRGDARLARPVVCTTKVKR